VDVRTPGEVKIWVEIVKRRLAYEANPQAFVAEWADKDAALQRKLVAARKRLNAVAMPDAVMDRAAELCIHLKTDGIRGQLTLMRVTRALAAYEGKSEVTEDHLKRMAGPALRHRLRRNPLDETGSGTRIDRAVSEVFGA